MTYCSHFLSSPSSLTYCSRFLSSPSSLSLNPLQPLSFFSNSFSFTQMIPTATAFFFIHSNDLEKSLYWKEDKEQCPIKVDPHFSATLAPFLSPETAESPQQLSDDALLDTDDTTNATKHLKTQQSSLNVHLAMVSGFWWLEVWRFEEVTSREKKKKIIIDIQTRTRILPSLNYLSIALV